jgi:macrolide-specific efflux system membrane fusion protein
MKVINKLKSIPGFVWRRKWWAISLLILGFIVMKFLIPGKTTEEQLEEYTVSTGTVTTSINSTGEIQASTMQDLTFGLQGRIIELKVKEGDEVKKGDYLGSLDTTSLNAQLKIAQGGLQSASANYNATKQSLDLQIQDVTNEVTSLDKQIAESDYKTTTKVNKNTVDKAELDVEITKNTLNATEDSLDNLEDEQELSEDVSQANEDVASNTSTDAEDLAQAQTDLSQHQYDSQINDSENNLENKEIATDQSKLVLDNTKLNSSHSDLISEIGLKKAEKTVELGSLTKQEKEIAKKNTLNALSGQILNAQGSVEAAQYNLKEARLFAPFAGTVLKMPFKIGEYFLGPQSTDTIQIGDLSSFIIKTDVNELDILEIEPGQKAIIEFEANPGVEYEGKVERINPAPVFDSTGVVNYEVEVSLPSEIEKVYHGLSVSIEIITEEKEAILQIPFVALQRKEDGQYVRVKNADGTISEKKVEIGIQSINNVEILSGLEEGEVIVY